MHRAAALTLVALAVSGCGRSVAPTPCPGVLQGKFQLTSTIVEGADCAAAAQVIPAGTLDVSFVDDTTAAVCTGRALADPITGTRSGDDVEVASAPEPAALTGCACALRVTERLSVRLTRNGAGTAVAFEGEVVNDIAPESGTTCAASGTGPCIAPCRARWTLVGTR